jgi:hypothetical protein
MSGPREHFRIRYPERERPWLTVGEFMLPVFDLSESGAGLARTHFFQASQSPREISIVFHDGGEFFTSAVFVRNNEERIAIRFTRLVPLSRILREQRRLNERFLQVLETTQSPALQR